MAVLYPFSENVRRLLAVPPEPGSTHRWLAQVSGGLKYVLSSEDCVAFLREVCNGMVRHRDISDTEIERAVAFGFGDDPKKSSGCNKAIDWPEADAQVIRRVLSEDTGQSSLVIGEDGKGHGDGGMGKKVDPNIERRTSNVEHRSAGVVEVVQQGTAAPTVSAAEALQTVFKPGELVCAGLDSSRPEIRAVEDWGEDAERMQFVCLNPMRGKWGTNLRGEPSKRCQANVRLRRYLVAEFDDPQMHKEMQAKLICWLGKLAPLVLVVDSGGKSLHGWFRVEEFSAKDQARFFAMACVLGADRTRWDICGWLRMPGGHRPREGGDVRQRILYSAHSTRVARSGLASLGGAA